MSRTFVFTVPFTAPPAAVHGALTDERYWRSRFDKADNAEVEISTPDGPGTIKVAMVEHVGGDRIPGLVRKVLKGDLTLNRTDNWGVLESDTAHGSFTGGSAGIASEFGGAYVLRPRGDGTSLEVSGKVAVKVRLVGGAIEGLVEQMFTKLVTGEGKTVSKWASEHSPS